MEDPAMVEIARYATRYCSERYGFDVQDFEILSTHWWESCKFLVDRIFYHGRSEKTSKVLYNMTQDAITENLDTDSPNGLLNMSNKQIRDTRYAFENMDVDGKSYKRPRDVEMLFGTITKNGRFKTPGLLHFIRNLPDANIVAYSISEISNDRILPYYSQLVSLRGIGHTIASSFLRDLTEMFYDTLGDNIRTIEAQSCLQPVDAYVTMVSERIGIDFEKSSRVHRARQIAEACLQVSISRRFPLRFSQGACWFGRNCFNIAMELLQKQN